MMYVYNNTDWPIYVDDVKTEIEGDSSCSAVGIGSKTVLFAPNCWTSTLDFEQTSFNRSYVKGKVRNLVEKGYLRVLTLEEYKQEMKKSQREKDLAIPKENNIPQGLGIYAKAIEDSKNVSRYSALIDDDNNENIKEEFTEEVKQETKSNNDDRFDRIENAILTLSNVVAGLVKKKPAKKRVLKKKKVVKSTTKKKVVTKKKTKKTK